MSEPYWAQPRWSQAHTFPAQHVVKASQHRTLGMFSLLIIFAFSLPCRFLEMMEARSRGHASPLTTNGQSPSSGSQSPIVPPSSTSTGSSSPGTPQPPQPPSTSSTVSPEPPSSFSPVPAPEAQPPHAPLPAAASPAPPAAAPPPKRSIISRLFGTSPAPEPCPPQPGGSRHLFLCYPFFFFNPCDRLGRQVANKYLFCKDVCSLSSFVPVGVLVCLCAGLGQGLCPSSWLGAVVCFVREAHRGH